MFFGKSFVFDGLPCENFDLMMYDIGGNTQGGGAFASPVSIIDEALPRRWRPVFYGAKQDRKLEFEIVFGVNTERIEAHRYLDRYEINAVATWLTGYTEYKELYIEQDDMQYFMYRCMVTALEEITYGEIPWAMRAVVTCDSPFAYMPIKSYQYTLSGETTAVIQNESSIHGYYYPTLVYEPTNGGDLSIVNHSDGDREFLFTALPAAAQRIEVNNDTMVITNSADLNLYPNFNKKFLRLKRGKNELTINGNGNLTIECRFPVNIGG